MATSCTPHSLSGGVTLSAGSITCSVPQTAPKCAAMAAGPVSPATSRSLPSASPSAAVPPMDEVGETRLALLVDRLDTEHLGGRLRRGGARWASSQLHLDRARDSHHSRPGDSGEDTLAEGRRDIANTHAHLSLLVLPLAFLSDVTQHRCSLVSYLVHHLRDKSSLILIYLTTHKHADLRSWAPRRTSGSCVTLYNSQNTKWSELGFSAV